VPVLARPKVLSWATDVEDKTLDQAAMAASLPFVPEHVALMPDAHVGIGATIGSVIPTEGAIIPAAVGVDIGCGMIAARTDLTSRDLGDNLDGLMPLIESRIPAGVGQGHDQVDADAFTLIGEPATSLTTKQVTTLQTQFGTLGSGNHFVEVCLDEADEVWVVLHSGSRGIGNQLATRAITEAKGVMKRYFIDLPDPDLAYFVEGTDEFARYITDMLWAQAYAMQNRALMVEAALRSLFEVVGFGAELERVNCHHNFTQKERHLGRTLWITRKGAIKADVGDRGVIPGSMGTRSYVVSGLGSRASYASCSHGAGRRMSRTEARKTLSVESLTAAMGDRRWNTDHAEELLDEHPDSYKDIDEVMAAQQDLVSIEHTLHQVFNYKGHK
jgi:tRNA-splicing ligase RtcB